MIGLTIEEIALWAKKKEIEALQKSKAYRDDPQGYGTFQGKASAFSEIWEKIVFNGRSVSQGTVHPEEYNKANEEWSERVNAVDVAVP